MPISVLVMLWNSLPLWIFYKLTTTVSTFIILFSMSCTAVFYHGYGLAGWTGWPCFWHYFTLYQLSGYFPTSLPF